MNKFYFAFRLELQPFYFGCQISDHQQIWGYKEDLPKGPLNHALLTIDDLIKYCHSNKL